MTSSPLVSNGRVDGQARAEDLELVIGGAELTVQLGELAGVLGGAAFGRGGEVGAEPIDNLGVLGRGLVSGGGGVAADPVEFGLVLGAPRGQRGVAGGQFGAVVLDEAAALGAFLVQGGVAGVQGGGQGGLGQRGQQRGDPLVALADSSARDAAALIRACSWGVSRTRTPVERAPSAVARRRPPPPAFRSMRCRVARDRGRERSPPRGYRISTTTSAATSRHATTATTTDLQRGRGVFAGGGHAAPVRRRPRRLRRRERRPPEEDMEKSDIAVS
jgi:hypothetical protein